MAEMSKMVDPNSVVAGPSSNVAQQDDEAAKDVRLVLSLIEQGKQYRAEFDEDWKTRKEYYQGKQWKSDTTKSKPVMNIIRQMIQATIPILTDQRPGFGAMAREPSDFLFAKNIGEMIEVWWDNTSMDHTLIEAIFCSMLFDAGVLKVVWDPTAEDGIGDVAVESVDPGDIYVPKGSKDFNKCCGWVIQKSRKQIGEMRRLFPDMADKIKADSDTGSSDRFSKGEELKIVSPTDQYSPKENVVNESVDTRKMVDVAECWIDDESVVEEMRETENGEPEKVVKKRFPRGKLITILPNQNLLLQSVENPYMHGKKPYVRIVDMILPGEFWGEGEAKSLMHTQRLINKTLKHMFDVFQLMSNPVWIVKKDSGVNVETITNSVSAVYEVNPNSVDPIKRDFPPSVQSGILDLYHTLITQSESISGISEISQGRKPTGVTAASAIENLQEAAQTRIRSKERNLQVSLQQLGNQVVALMLQFYRTPRVVRITNDAQGFPQYREFFIEEPEEGKYIFNQKNFVFDPERQQYIPEVAYTTVGPTKGMMDVKVLAGTAMPWAKTTRANIAFRLFDAQAIDDKELLDTLEWPNAEQVLQRIEERKAAAAQVEANAPPPPPAK
jgi:hypothetical protein